MLSCQTCAGPVETILSLGYMPPPNEMPFVEGHVPKPQTWLPTELVYCKECELAQLGHQPEPSEAFPDDYPYTSGATPALRRNFAELVQNVNKTLNLRLDDLVIDIGSNDGTLLAQFPVGQNVLGIEPTAAAHIANRLNIRTEKVFFSHRTARRIVDMYGKAKLVTCTNCFAHMPDPHLLVEGVRELLTDDGLFVSESHYLVDLINQMQYDTIYAEHLRYYSVRSIAKLLAAHKMDVLKIEHIGTHGGSIRVYAGKSTTPVDIHVDDDMPASELEKRLHSFAQEVKYNRSLFLSRLHRAKYKGARIVGIGAPSRASTVISYCHLDSGLVDYICEQPQSLKIGRFMPGTDIPVVDESRLYSEQPDMAILFSWHLAGELVPKIRQKGYRGDIIMPCSGFVDQLKEDRDVKAAVA